MTLAHCRTCNAPVIWVLTVGTGKRMPVDAEPALATRGFRLDEAQDPPVASYTGQPKPGERLYQSHFATCPQAVQHRKSP